MPTASRLGPGEGYPGEKVLEQCYGCPSSGPLATDASLSACSARAGVQTGVWRRRSGHGAGGRSAGRVLEERGVGAGGLLRAGGQALPATLRRNGSQSRAQPQPRPGHADPRAREAVARAPGSRASPWLCPQPLRWGTRGPKQNRACTTISTPQPDKTTACHRHGAGDGAARDRRRGPRRHEPGHAGWFTHAHTQALCSPSARMLPSRMRTHARALQFTHAHTQAL